MPAPAPISIADAHAQLTAPGSPFEMEIVDIDGRPTKTWKNAMPSIRALLEASRAHFVLDLNRYRQADHKIGRVGTVDNDGDRGTVQFAGRIRGLPGPSGTYPFTRTESRLRFGSPVACPARWFLDFEGTFETEQTNDGTVVTHREVFKFKRPWRWLAEPLLRRWLENDTAYEMIRFKKLIEPNTDAPASEP